MTALAFAIATCAMSPIRIYTCRFFRCPTIILRLSIRKYGIVVMVAMAIIVVAVVAAGRRAAPHTRRALGSAVVFFLHPASAVRRGVARGAPGVQAPVRALGFVGGGRGWS